MLPPHFPSLNAYNAAICTSVLPVPGWKAGGMGVSSGFDVSRVLFPVGIFNPVPIWSVWFMLVFVGIVAWALWPCNRRRLEDHGRIPFRDER